MTNAHRTGLTGILEIKQILLQKSPFHDKLTASNTIPPLTYPDGISDAVPIIIGHVQLDLCS